MTNSAPQKSAYDLISALISEELQDEQRQKLFDDLVSRPITSELLAEGVKVLKEKMVPVQLSDDAIDTCGTGGSGMKTINTSTITAFLVAAAEGKVAKHGNRSASGNCGCFDLLEELGIRTDLSPQQEQNIFKELGIAFLFAPLHHPALRFVAPLRKAHSKKTLFNLIGPLCNPAGVRKQLIGTGDDSHAEIIAEALQKLSSFGSMVVTGHDGLDEVSACSKTTIRTVKEDGILESVFSPEDFEIQLAHDKEVEGGDPKENSEVFLRLVKGEGDEAMKNLVLVNAAHALLLTDLAETIDDALVLAKETLSSGKVHNLFLRYRDYSNTL